MRFVRAAVILAAVLTTSCSDSALNGRVKDAASDTDENPDTDVTQQRCRGDDECRALATGPCDTATCNTSLGLCRVVERADCCNSNNDCPLLGAACLESRCPFPGSSCLIIDTCAGCQTAGDCLAIAPPCANAECVDTQCRFSENSACCGDDSDCNDRDMCTNDRCVEGRCTATHRCDDGQCAPGGPCCAGPVAFSTSFDPQPPWEVRTSDPRLRWQVLRSELASTPPAAMYLGNADLQAFVGDGDNVRTDVSFALGVLTSGQTAEIRFRILADIPTDAEAPGLSIYLQTPGARLTIPRVTLQKEWASITHKADVTVPGPWRLVFEFNGRAPVNSTFFFGVLVDDISVRHGCSGQTTPCQGDRECATDDPCVLGQCVGDRCQYSPNPICSQECRTGRDCEDDDRCTINSCRDGLCEARLDPSCGEQCQTPRDCEDGDPCTVHSCESGLCQTRVSPDCPERCTSDRECEDGVGCTLNFCADGICMSLGTPDCCTSNDDCRDNDPCTRDSCGPEGICSYEPAGPQCACSAERCDDRNRCTTDGCDAAGQCVHRANNLPGCDQTQCSRDADCRDDSACTVDRCTNGVCRNEPRADCCTSNAACDDGNSCTTDRCDAATARCSNVPTPNCGCGAVDCNDNNPCTVDACTDAGCVYRPDPNLPGCSGDCRSDSDCNDGRTCTTDRCVQGQCRSAVIDGCCENNAACNDQDACTRDRCDNNRCVYQTDPDCGPCATDACDDGDDCTIDACLADGRCEHYLDTTIPVCRCRILNCNDNDPCTADFCDAGRCQHRPTPNVPGCVDPDCTANVDCVDGDDCTIDLCDSNGQCQHETYPGCGCTDASCDDGDPCTKDGCSATGCTHERNPTLPGCDVRCTTNADCDDRNTCTINVCDADLGCLSLDRNGATCTDGDACTRGDKCVGSRCAPGAVVSCDDNDPCTADSCDRNSGACAHTPIDGPGCGPPCGGTCNDNNRCTTDTCDAATNQCAFARIEGCCQADAECVDADACTTDTCTNNRCQHTPSTSPSCNPNACRSDRDCNDGIPCTTDRCDTATGVYKNTRTSDCCSTDMDCNDSSACTVDVCVATFGLCVNANLPCDDGDPCTLDSCDPARGCRHAPDPACACQPEILWSRNFSASETLDMTVEGGLTVTWRVDGVRYQSAPRACRFGDSDGTDYATGFRVFGRATGPTISIPAETVTVNFNVWLDIDATRGEDLFTVRLISGNANALLWSRDAIPATSYRQWVPVSLTVPASFAGSDAQVRFVFDSVNGNGNTGQGVFIDDIVVKTTCAP